MKAFVNEVYAALGRAIACSAFMFITVFCAVGEELSFALPESNDGLPGVGPIRRYEWFQNLWVSRRALWADTAEADRGATIFLGDSIMQGWGESLAPAFPGLRVVNRGISGDTSRGVLIRLEQDVLALDPAAIILLIGTNDLEERASPEVIAANVSLILEAVANFSPTLPVVLCDVMPSSSTMNRPTGQIQQVNALLAELAGDYQNVISFDTFSLFADDEGNAKPAEFPDLLHPNETAYLKWADALRPMLSVLDLRQK